MTVTFSPISPVAFGNVLVNETRPITLTLVNQGATSVDLSGPPVPFTWDQAASVALASGATLVVNVGFAPTASGHFTGSITASDGSSCSLVGDGVVFTFSPSSIDFGGVEVGSQDQLTVTVTNPADVGAGPVTGPTGPFTMSPGAVTLQPGASATVTVMFAPSATQSYSASITGGGGQCPSVGFGESKADKYESETDSTETSTQPTGDPDATGTKYYQVAVPHFALDAPVGSGSAGTGPGNSFVRLGSFPSLTDAATQPVGFQASLNLAKLIGDATAIQAAEQKDLVPANEPTTPSYKGDKNYMLGFMDDTRYKKGEDALTNTAWESRRDDTKKLLTKGGWWDHADGNRISTTAGDKIEIIQGNYKMMVLGRQPAVPSTPTPEQLTAIAAGTLITDISGGLMAENGPSPTHCIKSIEYIYDDGADTWEVYQNNGIGKVFSSFYGDTVDIFLGDHKATWTGKVPDGYTVEDGDADILDAYNVYVKSLAIRTQLGESLISNAPAIVDHVWARKILSYKGSSGNKVAKISDTTHAGDILADVHADSITSKTNATTVQSVMTAMTVTNEVAAAAVVTNATQAGGVIFNSSTATEILSLNISPTGFGPLGITTINACPLGMITTINATAGGILAVDWCPAHFNIHVGTQQEQFTIGDDNMAASGNVAEVVFGYSLSALASRIYAVEWAVHGQNFLVGCNNIRLGIVQGIANLFPDPPPPVDLPAVD